MDFKEEEKLIKKAQDDPEAFAKLYDRYFPQIFGYVLKRVADVEAARDITSEVFLKALKGLWRFRWMGVPFSSLLYKIANGEVANYFRRFERWKTVQLEENSNPNLEVALAQERLKRYEEFLALQEKISQLPLIYQEVIVLKFYEKRQIKEMAEMLGKREGTVKSLLHRALEKLRGLME